MPNEGEVFLREHTQNENFPVAPLLYERVTFVLRTRTRICLPSWLGSMLHGALGSALRRMTCSDECVKEHALRPCAYALLFDRPRAREPLSGRLASTQPHPLVLVVPPPRRAGRMEPGKHLEFGAVLIGPAMQATDILIAAVASAALQGLGKGRGKAELVHIQREFGRLSSVGEVRGAEPHVTSGGTSEKNGACRDGHMVRCLDHVFHAGDSEKRRASVHDENPQGGTPRRLSLPMREPTGRTSYGILTITTQTPMRLYVRHRLITKPRFSDIVLAAVRRLEALDAYFGFNSSYYDEATVMSVCSHFYEVEAKWGRYSVMRFSSRQGRRHPMEGIKGTGTWRTPDVSYARQVLPLLRAAGIVGLGKAASFGFGRIETNLIEEGKHGVTSAESE